MNGEVLVIGWFIAMFIVIYTIFVYNLGQELSFRKKNKKLRVYDFEHVPTTADKIHVRFKTKSGKIVNFRANKINAEITIKRKYGFRK